MMKWRLVDKSKSIPPKDGNYTKWKPQLSAEAGGQCVYCCIRESQFGGIRNFHVEHFRPKSKYPHLENDYGNLFFACGICNTFKSDDWTGDHQAGDYSTSAYPDPSKVDYSDFLSIATDGLAHSEHFTGRYIIERLHINRAQMVGVRALRRLLDRGSEIVSEIEKSVDSGEIPESEKDAAITSLIAIQRLFAGALDARPYNPDQLRMGK